MDLHSVMTSIQGEITRLQTAYDALAGVDANGSNGNNRAKRSYVRRGPGRPPNNAKPKAKRYMSAAARRRISVAMKARWAARRA